MSVKIRLIMDTIPYKVMEGYVFNDDAYNIRDLLVEAMKKYEDSKDDKDLTKKTHKQVEERFYDRYELEMLEKLG